MDSAKNMYRPPVKNRAGDATFFVGERLQGGEHFFASFGE
jgi:hypothetical protein